jgi:diamine N-acetyltransferase
MIYGERIRLRGVERGDLPTFVKWINDPEVQQGIGIYHPFSQAEEDGWFEKMLTHPVDEHVLAIEAHLPGKGAAESDEGAGQANWQLIGICGFGHIDWHNRNAEFGINIGEKSYWNKGYGTEAVRLLVKHGFNTLNLNRIFLHVFENNPRAIRAYEKAGFIHEGRERQAEFKNGKYIDVLRMSLLKDEF